MNKSPECAELASFRNNNPEATWEDYRAHNGKQSYESTRALIFDDQGGLCAYCEASVSTKPAHHQRVEHFNSKRAGIQYHLDWQNLLGVCTGGESSSVQNKKERLDNLSCDAHKDKYDRSVLVWDGLVLFPLSIPSGSALFELDKRNGELIPSSQCEEFNIPHNQYSTTKELLQNTVKVFNLNCDRLCKARLVVFWEFERVKKVCRLNNDRAELENLILRWRGIHPFQTVRDLMLKDAQRLLAWF